MSAACAAKVTVYDALEAVRLADPLGLLRPEDVVEAARDEASVLHSHFTWDDTEAARKQRLAEARHLIRVTVTVLPNTSEPVRAFVSLSTERGERKWGEVTGGAGYSATVAVMSDAERRKQLLADAHAEMQAFERKYSALVELVPVFEAMRKARSRASTKKPVALAAGKRKKK